MATPDPTDLDWLALCLVTESNRPDEWSAIAQVIENRRRTGHWGSTYKSVVLAPMQFSAFNVLTGSRGDVRPETLGSRVFERLAKEESPLLLMHSAIWVYRAVRLIAPGTIETIYPPITPATLHYYSPVGMRPVGSAPFWAAIDAKGKPLHAKRLYTPDGIDPERFVFAEEVA